MAHSYPKRGRLIRATLGQSGRDRLCGRIKPHQMAAPPASVLLPNRYTTSRTGRCAVIGSKRSAPNFTPPQRGSTTPTAEETCV
jgi:hypothetical protein